MKDEDFNGIVQGLTEARAHAESGSFGLAISAAGRAELGRIIFKKYGLLIGPDRLDPALRRPTPHSHQQADIQRMKAHRVIGPARAAAAAWFNTRCTLADALVWLAEKIGPFQYYGRDK